MARQKSEDRTVPKGRRKPVPTRGVEQRGGGKAVPVDEQTRQLELFRGTAEVRKAQAERVDGGVDAGQPAATPRAMPKPRNKDKTVVSATMEEVTKRLREEETYPGPSTDSARRQTGHRLGLRLWEASISLGVLALACRGPRTPQRVLRRAGTRVTAGAMAGCARAHRRPGAAYAGIGMSRGRKPADDGVSNPSPRRAVCEQHSYGSVRGAPRERGAYSISSPCFRPRPRPRPRPRMKGTTTG